MGMNKYLYVAYLSPDQARAEIIMLGNSTGAEVNNYVLREAIGHLRAGLEFPLLDQLEWFIVQKYRKQIKHYLGDCNTTGENCVYVLRDKLNMGLALDAKYKGDKKFLGDCMRHGCCDFNVYGSQNINYKCVLCLQERTDNDIAPVPVIYNLDRNILIADFIKRNRIDLFDFSIDTGIQVKSLQRYLNNEETVTGLHWMLIKNQISRCLLTGRYTISRGLTFATVFKTVIARMEGTFSL